jgi:putative ABC transport system substrate-binding protein
VTGISQINAELGSKRLELLRELVPRARHIALLVDPNNPTADVATKDTQAAAAAGGPQIEIVSASNNREIDAVFASLVKERIDALLVSPSSLFSNRRVQLQLLAARHAIPTVYVDREDAQAGGLMSYGPNIADTLRQVGIYAGRILKGEKPGDLPVTRPTKFELVINMQTARTLGIEIPPTLLALADEVIE